MKRKYVSANSLIFISLVCLLILASGCLGTSLDASLLKELGHHCPLTDPEIHEDTVLSGAKDAGNYVVIADATNMAACVHACCYNSSCHVALLHKQHCVNLECKSAEVCQLTAGNGTSVVVVRSVDLGNHSEGDAQWKEQNRDKSLIVSSETGSGNKNLNDDLRVLTNPSNITQVGGDRRCEYGLRHCGKNEECVPLGNRRRDGVCSCLHGFHRREVMGECVMDESTTSASTEESESTTYSPDVDDGKTISHMNSSSPDISSFTVASTTVALPLEFASTPASNVSSPKPVGKLVVSINNKTVYLHPDTTFYEDRVTLSAYAIGAKSNCKYEWTLLQQPQSDDHGSVSGTNSQTITLSHLSEGVYIFKVVVDAPGVHGEAAGNVTVHSPKRINQPPKAIISPSQEIKLPTSGVIIDGSGSTDDDGIESYHWEMVTAPLGYKLPDQTEISTLQLTDLIPGNYTIMLRVRDKEGLEGNATTVVNVIKETDYPPTANAGGDQIIYLPQTEIILYGNLSTDDHGIDEWEWTKGPKDSGKAVDMQDTRTPFLRLSNLEEGHYQFILRVTDSIGQSSNTSVYIYVQKPNLTAPKANARGDVQIVLPNTTVMLDGSHSTDTAVNTHWLWKQFSGPNTAHFSKMDEVKVNISGLTKGKYVFGLTVWNGDDPTKNTTDNITVTVIQDRNVPPKANAGGDFSVTLPVSVVVVDGSKSTDDVAVTKWLWERDGTSLAAGKVINGSDNSPVLMFTDVVAGGYVWKLTVWDDQGASSSDTVSIIVKEERHHMDEVEVVVGGDIGALTYSQLSTLLQKLELFLHTTESIVTIHLISLTGLPHSGRVRLTFLANAGKEVVKGPQVVSMLRHQVMSESSELLDLPLLSVDTVVCQNNCSGHGECIQATRECRCHTWWMESFIRRHMADGVQNCDWSVVYVFVMICLVVLISGLLGWGISSLLVRVLGGNSRPRRKPPRYSLLDGQEEGIKLKSRLPGNLLDSASESDSDVEILFDSRKKHKADKLRNGYHKLPRIRT
ncbi:dyslexia-associated protein KIAA0319-like protein [Panulirus ornatus]|uniref:dyslexia-associated protein KIAA0319-like protein n=1 Tax=Panulirus ornatus TaxID=150431 RepID=UPI003A8B11F0